MSVPVGTVKRDKSTAVAKQPKGKAVTPAELRQIKKDARAKMRQGQEAIEEADEEDEEDVVKPEEARLVAPLAPLACLALQTFSGRGRVALSGDLGYEA